MSTNLLKGNIDENLQKFYYLLLLSNLSNYIYVYQPIEI